MNLTRVLALLPLFVGLGHSFSWDFAVGEDNRLKFYYNGTVTHAENIPAVSEISSVIYDPVHNMVLFADYHKNYKSIFSFDISTREIQTLVTRRINNYIRCFAYDPVTQSLFWNEGYNIYSLSLKPASSKKANDGKLLITLNHNGGDIAVDSCGGFIYWITGQVIERAAFDGSKREILLNTGITSGRSLAIDQQEQKMYWTDEIKFNLYSIESADLNGKNRKTFYFIGTEVWASGLAVSKDFIYWWSYKQRAILQLPKSQRGVEPIVYSESSPDCLTCQRNEAIYTFKEETMGIKSCEALKSLTLDVAERYGSICQNYCFKGNCSVSAEGHPNCRCNAGYSGERCEVNACYMYCLNNGVCSLNEVKKPVCQCTADYKGERCDVSICKDYCLQGNCSVNTQGQPTCRCNSGYSGERCEVNACHGYCQNNGNCSLNDQDEPVCQCTADYEGERCDVAATHTGACVCADKMMQQILLEVKQVREDLQYTQQLYSDKLEENAAKIQICEETMTDNQQNHDETTSKTQTLNIKF